MSSNEHQQVKNTLNILNWNIENLMSKLASGECVQYPKQCDIVCLTEAFLAGCVQLYSWSDFMTFSAPPKKLTTRGRPSGGAIVLIRKSIADSLRNIPAAYDNVLRSRSLEIC